MSEMKTGRVLFGPPGVELRALFSEDEPGRIYRLLHFSGTLLARPVSSVAEAKKYGAVGYFNLRTQEYLIVGGATAVGYVPPIGVLKVEPWVDIQPYKGKAKFPNGAVVTTPYYRWREGIISDDVLIMGVMFAGDTLIATSSQTTCFLAAPRISRDGGDDWVVPSVRQKTGLAFTARYPATERGGFTPLTNEASVPSKGPAFPKRDTAPLAVFVLPVPFRKADGALHTVGSYARALPNFKKDALADLPEGNPLSSGFSAAFDKALDVFDSPAYRLVDTLVFRFSGDVCSVGAGGRSRLLPWPSVVLGGKPQGSTGSIATVKSASNPVVLDFSYATGAMAGLLIQTGTRDVDYPDFSKKPVILNTCEISGGAASGFPAGSTVNVILLQNKQAYPLGVGTPAEAANQLAKVSWAPGAKLSGSVFANASVKVPVPTYKAQKGCLPWLGGFDMQAVINDGAPFFTDYEKSTVPFDVGANTGIPGQIAGMTISGVSAFYSHYVPGMAYNEAGSFRMHDGVSVNLATLAPTPVYLQEVSVSVTAPGGVSPTDAELAKQKALIGLDPQDFSDLVATFANSTYRAGLHAGLTAVAAAANRAGYASAVSFLK